MSKNRNSTLSYIREYIDHTTFLKLQAVTKALNFKTQGDCLEALVNRAFAVLAAEVEKGAKYESEEVSSIKSGKA